MNHTDINYRPILDLLNRSNDDAYTIIRHLLIDDMTPADELASYCDDAPNETMIALITAAIRRLDDRTLATMRLDYSLCPMHHIDYAICFDDENDECATIRTLHPEHDT